MKEEMKIILVAIFTVFMMGICEACTMPNIDDYRIDNEVVESTPLEITLVDTSTPESRFLSEIQSNDNTGKTSVNMSRNTKTGMYEISIQKKDDSSSVYFTYFTDKSSDVNSIVDALYFTRRFISDMTVAEFCKKCELVKTGEPAVFSNSDLKYKTLEYKTNYFPSLCKFTDIMINW